MLKKTKQDDGPGMNFLENFYTFQAASPHPWNELPSQLRTIRSIETFKNSIKTFLFKKSFQ